MARVKFYLDKTPAKDGRCHIKLTITHNGASALMPTGVFVRPEQWNAGDQDTDPCIKKTCPGYRVLNSILVEKIEAVQEQINLLMLGASLSAFKTATHIKNHIKDSIDGKQGDRDLVASCFKSFIETSVNEPSKSMYIETLAKIAKYHDIDTLRLGDLTVGWLKNFESKMKNDGLAVNSIARHMREVRAVYNDAIDHGIAQLNDYPFRRFKIKQERTRKRALTLEQLRELRDYPCTEAQRQYRDIFTLIFYMGGINIGDLFRLTEIENGYIYYSRSKTHRPYQIKVEPEAMEIIERYRGHTHLLAAADRYANHEDFTRRINRALQSIGAPLAEKSDRTKPGPAPVDKKNGVFPGLTTYWARHTLATLMAEIDIPKETIAKVLGHADNDVTSIYIKFNQNKIDEAMRKVIDYLKG